MGDMEMPWGCRACGHENMVDLENLSSWPLDKIVTIQGFECEKCKHREAVFYTTISLEETMRKLMRYPPGHPQFRFRFYGVLRKARGIHERAEREWLYSCSYDEQEAATKR